MKTFVTAKHFAFLPNKTEKGSSLASDDLQRCIEAMNFVQMLVNDAYLDASSPDGKKMMKSFAAVTPVLQRALNNSRSNISACPLIPTGRPMREDHDRID